LVVYTFYKLQIFFVTKTPSLIQDLLQSNNWQHSVPPLKMYFIIPVNYSQLQQYLCSSSTTFTLQHYYFINDIFLRA